MSQNAELFPGHDLFTPAQQAHITEKLGWLRETQVQAVRDVYEQSGGRGFDDRGFPDTRGVSIAESLIMTRGAGILALQTARVLERGLPITALVEIVLDRRHGGAYPYEAIPQRVHAFLSDPDAFFRGSSR